MHMSFKLIDAINSDVRGHIDIEVRPNATVEKVWFNGMPFEGAHFVRDFVEILVGQGYIARKLNGDESNEENINGLSTF